MIKKSVAAVTTSLAITLLGIQTAFAGSGGFWDNPQTGATPNVAAQGTLGGNITTIINFFLGLLGLIAVAFLIYAGVLMVTSGGDTEAVEKGKKIITYAIVGIIIIILSYTVVSFVTTALG